MAPLASRVGASLDRVVAVVALLAKNRRQWGAGYLVEARRVVTAEHCTRDVRTGEAAVEIRVLSTAGSIGVVPADGVLADRELDVSVLTLAEPLSAVSLEPVRFGRVDRSQPGVLDDVTGVGFPLFRRDSALRLRASMEFHGKVYATDGWEKGELVMRQPDVRPGPIGDAVDDRASSSPIGRQAPWGGLSGAMAFYEGRAIGVVIEHHPREGPDALTLRAFDHVAEKNRQLAELIGLPLADGLSNVSSLKVRVPYMAPELPAEFVDRPRERAIVGDNLDTAAIERVGAPGVAVVGTAGFGKSVLAAKVCHDQRVRFVDGVLWVTLGESPSQQQLVGRCRDLVLQFGDDCPQFTDPRAAGAYLGQVLGSRNVLLVVDDVWDSSDLEPFLQGGVHCVRLITTRNERVEFRTSWGDVAAG
jgi:hypothetical protein